MSTRVVIPPAAAALVAVAKPSHSVLPGSQTCTCESTRPGSSTASGPSSTTREAGARLPAGSTATIRPSAIPMLRAASAASHTAPGAWQDHDNALPPGRGRGEARVERARHSGAAVTADAAHRRRAGGVDLLDPGVTEHGL